MRSSFVAEQVLFWWLIYSDQLLYLCFAFFMRIWQEDKRRAAVRQIKCRVLALHIFFFLVRSENAKHEDVTKPDYVVPSCFVFVLFCIPVLLSRSQWKCEMWRHTIVRLCSAFEFRICSVYFLRSCCTSACAHNRHVFSYLSLVHVFAFSWYKSYLRHGVNQPPFAIDLRYALFL